MAIDPADSAVVTLSPAFLEALRKVVPRRRRAKLPYIIGVGLLAVVGVVGADRSTREFMAERWHHARVEAPAAAALPPRPEAAAVNRIVPPTAMSDLRIETPIVPVVSSPESTSATAATPKKTRPHRAAPQSKERRASPQGT
jgi:hypothetical protein